MDISIVIPVYNQVHYTRLCLESLRQHGAAGAEIIVVDNGSSDETSGYLAEQRDITVIGNRENLGCAAAWNQGVKASSGDWVVLLNNDVLLSPGWLSGLLEFAVNSNVDIASPAFREGNYNYDLSTYAAEFTMEMKEVVRTGVATGICFMVRRQVFDTVGLFDENFRIGQFEDTDFFRRARQAGFRLASTGSVLIHHFGSVTQDDIRKKRTVRPYEAENRSYYLKKWKLGLWSRFVERRATRWQGLFWRMKERLSHGHSLVEKWERGRLCYY